MTGLPDEQKIEPLTVRVATTVRLIHLDKLTMGLLALAAQILNRVWEAA